MGLLGLVVGISHAMCGVYAGDVGSDLPTNQDSALVIAHDATGSTLTLVNDFDGASGNFGFVMPVPEGWNADQASLADPAALEVLAQYTAPRIVTYTCEDVRNGAVQQQGIVSSGCGGVQSLTPMVLGQGEMQSVVVHSYALVGNYEISVVEEKQSGSLNGWLDAEGFEMPPGADKVIAEHADGGAWFMAVRVNNSSDSSWLSPLSLHFDHQVLSIPLRLGSLSSSGQQDLVIYGLSTGALGIMNYEMTEVEEECLLRDQADGFYDDMLDNAFGAVVGQASWLQEFSWAGGACDPCGPLGPIDPETLQALGHSGDTAGLVVSRVRLRYQADQIDEDLALQVMGAGTDQTRYIEYLAGLEGLFPICGEGWAADPGECSGVGVNSASAGGCTLGGSSASGLLALAAALGLLRRRRT